MIEDDLTTFMKGHFGSEAPNVIHKTMEKKGLTSLEELNPLQVEEFIDVLIKDNFSPVMSGMKARMITAQLFSIFKCTIASAEQLTF